MKRFLSFAINHPILLQTKEEKEEEKYIMSKSSLMDLMNTDFSDEDSDEDQESSKLFEKYGNANPIHEAIENDDANAIPVILKSSG